MYTVTEEAFVMVCACACVRACVESARAIVRARIQIMALTQTIT